jgi:uncharacterized membrane protein HdeD (DUF308 family)
MADKKQKSLRKIHGREALPYSRSNYLLFGIAILTLVMGYWALAQPPVDGALTMTVAPILLVIGYCVLIPLAIMLKSRKKEQSEQ